jgi:hypothetical protein
MEIFRVYSSGREGRGDIAATLLKLALRLKKGQDPQNIAPGGPGFDGQTRTATTPEAAGGSKPPCGRGR